MINPKAIKTIFFILLLSFILAQPLGAQYYVGSVLGVKSEKSNSASENRKRMTVGEVEKVTGNKITVEDKKGNKTKEIPLEGSVKISNQDNRLLNIGQIKPKDKVAIIATEEPLATGTAGLTNRFRVYVKQQSQVRETKRRAIHGVITAVSGNSVTLAHQIQRERVSRLTVTSDTVIKIKGVEEGTLSDLVPGLRIASVGDLNSEGILEAVRIHVIPGLATGLLSPVATNSPTPTQVLEIAPSATPSVSINNVE